MIDFDKVIRDAATKNGVVIKKDDEVMLHATVLNNMLDDLDASMKAALEVYKSGHEGIALRWRADAEASAAKILDAALEAGREAAAKIMDEGAGKVVSVIHEELTSAILHQKAELDAATSAIKRYSFYMLFTAGAMLGAAILVSVW